MKLYVASSWRNEIQPAVVTFLRGAGHTVYDFRAPAPNESGFAWADIDPDWQNWHPATFRDALEHPVAVRGFALDLAALQAADGCVLVLPCGRSAHLEAGYCVGAGKPCWILVREPCEPELMYAMAEKICRDLGELQAEIKQWEVAREGAALAEKEPD